jgi:MFS family permease
MSPSPHGMAHAWRAMRHRNFQLYFAGQGTSLIGTWMTRIATGWLVYRLTQSALLLGVVAFSSQILSFALGPVAGVWVERLNRRHLLIVTQAAAAAQSLAMAALVFTHTVNIWNILALSAFQGLINAFDMPGRQSFLVQTVDDPADLGNAIAISSVMANGARLIGPAIAGMLIAAAGEGWCFLVDGLSYFAVIASLMAMRLRVAAPRRTSASLFEQMREGWDYVRASTPIRTTLVLFSLASLMGYPFMVLLPIFAAQVLHGGPHTLGWLSGAVGIGALVSSLSLAMRRNAVGLPRAMLFSLAVLGAALIFFGLSHTLWISLAFMAAAGFGMLQCAAAANTLLQSLVHNAMRARVMSYYTMAFFGSAPFGSLFAGALAHRIGAPFTVALTGVCCLAGAAWYALRFRSVESALRDATRKPAERLAPATDNESVA